MTRQITEDQWEKRYEWMPTDAHGNCELLDDIPDEIEDDVTEAPQ